MRAAIEREGEAQRALLQGDRAAADAVFRGAADLYRQSWEAAPPGGYGRLVGMLKSAILAGGGLEEARYVRDALAEDETDSPAAAYARTLAALAEKDEKAARQWSEHMRGASEAFDRAADALAAVATGDGPAYSRALEEIVRDFEQRSRHLTGVAIADTAVVLDRLATARGISTQVKSALLPREGDGRASSGA